ncbi:MAG: DUF4870 domain-containing protein [Planctomycetota bacterium]|jgi:uncharacterized Tic20 family protein
MSIADDLERLRQLYASGDLSDEEYAQAKAAVLNATGSASDVAGDRNVSEHPSFEAPRDDAWEPPGREQFGETPYQGAAGGRSADGEPVSNSLSRLMSERQWGMVLHLSQFAGYAAPILGFVLPIALWQLLKDDIPSLDRHGRIIVNWIISEVIYLTVALVLAFVAVGFLLVPAVGVLGVIFPIIGAIKANEGEFWEYPLTIRFLHLSDRDRF